MDRKMCLIVIIFADRKLFVKNMEYFENLENNTEPILVWASWRELFSTQSWVVQISYFVNFSTVSILEIYFNF